MKDIIILCPTVEQADIACRSFCKKNESFIDKRTKYDITLKNGQKIMFRGETEGQRVLLGTHADIITMDEFTLLE